MFGFDNLFVGVQTNYRPPSRLSQCSSSISTARSQRPFCQLKCRFHLPFRQFYGSFCPYSQGPSPTVSTSIIQLASSHDPLSETPIFRTTHKRCVPCNFIQFKSYIV